MNHDRTNKQKNDYYFWNWRDEFHFEKNYLFKSIIEIKLIFREITILLVCVHIKIASDCIELGTMKFLKRVLAHVVFCFKRLLSSNEKENRNAFFISADKNLAKISNFGIQSKLRSHILQFRVRIIQHI